MIMNRVAAILILILINSLISLSKEYFDYSGLHFEALIFTKNGSIFTSDSLLLGYKPVNNETFKPLLSIKGKFICDTSSSSKSFVLEGQCNLIILSSNDKLSLGTKTVSNTFYIDSLKGSGSILDTNSIDTLTVVGNNFTPSKINFINPDSTSATKNSFVAMQGKLEVKELRNLKIPIKTPILIKSINGKLDLEQCSITVTNPQFLMKSAAIKSASITVSYSPPEKSFSIFGNADFQFQNDTLGVKLGIGEKPGIKIINGNLSYIGLTLNNKFAIRNFRMQGDSVKLLYDFDSSYFKIFGGPVSAFYNADTLKIDFYDEQKAGILIKNGELIRMSARFSDKIRIGGLEFNTSNLNFEWLRIKDQFTVYGGPVDINLPNNDKISVIFGISADSAGMVIKNGTLKQLILKLSDKIHFGGATLNSKNLFIEYFSDSSKYVIFGDSTRLDLPSGEFFLVGLGNKADSAGIIIRSGKIRQMKMNLKSSFTIGGANIKESNLIFEYISDSTQFYMYGGSTILTLQGGEVFNVKLGNSRLDPGLKISDGKIKQFKMSLTSKFTIGSADFNVDSLTFVYQSETSLYKIYGSSKFTTKSGEMFSVSFHDSISPGLVIKNGKLEKLLVTINNQFTIGSLNFKTNSLTLEFLKDSSEYVIYGGPVDCYLDGSKDLKLAFGDSLHPGLIIKSGKLKQMITTVSSNFQIGGATFIVKDLTFEYFADLSKFVMFGKDAKFNYSNNETIDVTFGFNADSAGLVVQNGKIKQIILGITSNFKIGGATLSSDKLFFEYFADSSEFVIYGGPTKLTLVGNEQFQVTFGSRTTPGLIISSGKLKQFNATVVSDFTIGNLTFKVNNLTFQYFEDSLKYVMFGGPVGFNLVSGEQFYVKFGDSPKNAGLIVLNGKLKQFIMSVTSNFNISGCTFQSNSLTFEYFADSSKYVLFGGPTGFVLLNSDTFNITFGTNANNAGLVIRNGKLVQLITKVYSSFNIGGARFSADSLTFEYFRDSSEFVLFGGPTGFTLQGGEQFYVTLGNSTTPGLIIRSGKLKQLIATVTSKFTVGGLKFNANKLTFEYFPDSSKYVMFGGPVDFKLDSGEDFEISFGDIIQPGLIVKHGKLLQMICSVSADFTIGGATIGSKGLTFEYFSDSSKFVIFGGPVSFKIEDESLSVTFGQNKDKAGLKIVNKVLKDIFLIVNGDLNLGGLNFKSKNLSFYYLANIKQYKMWGEVDFNLINDTLNLKLGVSESDPGLLIQNGKIKQIEFGITSDFKIGALQVTSNGAGFFYLSKDDTSKTKYGKKKNHYGKPVFGLFGGIGIKTFFSAYADAGTMQDPGIFIIKDGTHHRFEIDTIYASIGNIDLGVFGINNASFGYSKNYLNFQGSFNIASTFDVGAKFVFVKTKIPPEKDTIYNLSEIDLVWQAEEVGIPIGESDVFLTRIDGKITNIDLLRKNPRSLTITAGMDLCFGEHYYNPSDKKAFEPVHIRGQATISGYSMSLDAKAKVIAFGNEDFNNISKDNWKSYLGEADASVLIDWTHNDYYFKSKIDFPSDPGVSIDSKLGVKNSTIGYLGDIKLIIPHKIPIIGGKKFASADGALLIRMDKPHKNLVAGWVTISIGYWKLKVKKEYGIKLGFPMDFNNPSAPKDLKFDLIGSSEIKDIKKELNSVSYKKKDEELIASSTMKSVIHTYSLDSSQNAAYCIGKVDFKTPVDLSKVVVSIKGPISDYNTIVLIPNDSSGFDGVPSNSKINLTDSCMRFMFGNSLDYNPDSNWVNNKLVTPAPPPLIPGTYQIITYYPSEVKDDVEFEAVFKPAEPLLNLETKKLSDSIVQIDVSIWNGNSNADSTEFTIFSSDSTTYNGEVILSTAIDNSLFKRIVYKNSYLVKLTPLVPGKNHYYYASLHDESSGLIYSGFSPPIESKPDIYGFIKDSATNKPFGGVVLYIDDNENGICDNNEISAQTDSISGVYYFKYPKGSKGLTHSKKVIRIIEGLHIKDYKLSITQNSPFKNPAVINFFGQPIEVNFTIKEEKK